jgi:hypothetical protein
MPHHGQRLGILVGQNPQLHVARGRQLEIDADDLPVDLAGERRLGQPRANIIGHAEDSYTLLVRPDATIGQMHIEHDSRARAQGPRS